MRVQLMRASLVFAIVLFAAAAMAGVPVNAVSVEGYGEYGNDAGVLIDRFIPPEETEYQDPACVYWHSPDVYFIIDLGEVIQIRGITLQGDNNDDYILEASVDGNNFAPLLVVGSGWGEKEFGMETISTVSRDPEYVPEAVITPTRARYLKLSGGGGDDAYGVSEVLIFGGKTASAEVPEPAGTDDGGMATTFNAMDVDRDGKVSLDEYAARWQGKLDVQRNFTFFDKNRNGYIERAEYMGETPGVKIYKTPR